MHVKYEGDLMKIMVFLHGTIIMHNSGLEKTRKERVKQVIEHDESIYDFSSYIPVGRSYKKINIWVNQGAEIFYLSSNENLDDINNDLSVLKKFDFPKGQLLFRKDGQSYKDIAEEIMPDILIEDDCESIGGEFQMVYPNMSNSSKKLIKSIVLKEFEGIDLLPTNISVLKNYK